MSEQQAPFVSNGRGLSFIYAGLVPCIFIAILLLPAEAKVVQENKALSVYEKSEGVLGKELGNYLMVDQNGRQLLFSFLKGKPTLVTFMYLDCADICIIMSNYIQEFMESVDPDLKEQIQVLSISIDPANDTPERLLNYGRAFTGDFSNWSFVTATSSETLSKLVNDLGYTYEKVQDGFEHLNRVTLIGADGTVARHFYGADFEFKEMEDSIRAVLSGSGASTFLTKKLNSFLLYCSNYDPISKTYKVDYPFLIVIGINLILVAFTILFMLKPSLLRYILRTK